MKVAVLISGRGSNLQALIEKSKKYPKDIEIVSVITDKLHAEGIFYALENDIPLKYIGAETSKPVIVKKEKNNWDIISNLYNCLSKYTAHMREIRQIIEEKSLKIVNFRFQDSIGINKSEDLKYISFDNDYREEILDYCSEVIDYIDAISFSNLTIKDSIFITHAEKLKSLLPDLRNCHVDFFGLIKNDLGKLEDLRDIVVNLRSDVIDACDLIINYNEILPPKNKQDDYTRQVFEMRLTNHLKSCGVELVVLAGFMKILSKQFCDEWAGKCINIHPSLLPNFPGLNTHQRCLDLGLSYHGCTVHFVTAEVDGGPIIEQAYVDISKDETEETLAEKVLEQEHILLPNVVLDICTGKIQSEVTDRIRINRNNI